MPYRTLYPSSQSLSLSGSRVFTALYFLWAVTKDTHRSLVLAPMRTCNRSLFCNNRLSPFSHRIFKDFIIRLYSTPLLPKSTPMLRSAAPSEISQPHSYRLHTKPRGAKSPFPVLMLRFYSPPFSHCSLFPHYLFFPGIRDLHRVSVPSRPRALFYPVCSSLSCIAQSQSIRFQSSSVYTP